MNKIAFATGSRADYGIVRNYLRKLNDDSNIELSILTTGALLSNEFGHQVKLVYEDGFRVQAEIELPLDTASNYGVVHCMSVALDKFGEHFHDNKYDLLIILGDRYEMLSVAIAAAMQKIPILHLHGGEATYANYDEFIRHAITKMSYFHITSTEEYRNRVIQLGEQPDSVFNLGALGAENCLCIDEGNVPENVKELAYKGYFVVLFHPETLTNIDVREQINALLGAVDEHNGYQYIFLGSNADTNSELIRNAVKTYVSEHSNSLYFENLHTDAYHYLLKNGICLIGNSSSGIIEAPSLGIYTVNIGERQQGRVRGNSVIDVECNKDDISKAIDKVLGCCKTVAPNNPYYQEDSAKKYYECTVSILSFLKKHGIQPKKFYDVPVVTGD